MTGNADLPLAILISGRGGNMLAIAAACQSGRSGARVARVIADRIDTLGEVRARERGLPLSVVARRALADAAQFEQALRQSIEASGARLIALAGFMRILSAEFVANFAGRMLNIHPSLLPAFPGLHTHERALAAGASEHGCSVHVVTSELDAGPVLLQARVPVLPGDTVATLAARVTEQEHRVYPQVIEWIAAGRLRIDGAVPHFDGRPLAQPLRAN